MMTGRRGTVMVVAIGLLLTAVAARAFLWPGVEEVVTFDGRILGGAEVEAGIVVVVEPFGEPDGVRLVRLDPGNGEVQAERELPGVDGLPDVGASGRAVLLRIRGHSLPGVPIIDELYEGRADFPDDQWLLVIDGNDLAPVRQIRLPDIGPFVYEPLTVLDGKVWFHGSREGYGDGDLSSRGTIDLATGRMTAEEIWYAPGAAGVRNVQRTADSLIVVRWNQIGVIDRRTGEMRTWHTFTGRMLPLAAGFVFHDGSFWMSGSERDDWNLVYRYDPETGAMTEPRPAADLPVWSFDDGDERWELYEPYGERQVLPSAEPERDSVWRRVGIDTGEVLGEYRLGRWRVRFTTGDHAWLVRNDGDTATLGRVGL
jgi:hypothetical protein